MSVKILSINHDTQDLMCILAQEYIHRLTKRLPATIESCAPAARRKTHNTLQAETQEASLLLNHSEGCTRVAMHASAKHFASSEDFAHQLQKLLMRGKPVAFLIGGASGLADDVLQKSDTLWSLSPLTLPHRLALLVLCEQLYRAHEIWRGSPYHK